VRRGPQVTLVVVTIPDPAGSAEVKSNFQTFYKVQFNGAGESRAQYRLYALSAFD
jgi:hypothetical protein